MTEINVWWFALVYTAGACLTLGMFWGKAVATSSLLFGYSPGLTVKGLGLTLAILCFWWLGAIMAALKDNVGQDAEEDGSL